MCSNIVPHAKPMVSTFSNNDNKKSLIFGKAEDQMLKYNNDTREKLFDLENKVPFTCYTCQCFRKYSDSDSGGKVSQLK